MKLTSTVQSSPRSVLANPSQKPPLKTNTREDLRLNSHPYSHLSCQYRVVAATIYTRYPAEREAPPKTVPGKLKRKEEKKKKKIQVHATVKPGIWCHQVPGKYIRAHQSKEARHTRQKGVTRCRCTRWMGIDRFETQGTGQGRRPPLSSLSQWHCIAHACA